MTRLMNSIRPDYYDNISKARKRKLSIIDDWDFSPVKAKLAYEIENKQLNYQFPGSLVQGIEQLKRYYALSLLEHERKKPHAISIHVDPFWHTHIIFTNDYQDFCNRVFGRYLNHVPLDQNKAEDVEEVAYLYARSLERQGRVFKRVNRQWWPAETRAICVVTCRFM